MKIKVERCLTSRQDFVFRLHLPTGGREFVYGERWCREVAQTALDLLEKVHGYCRSSIFCSVPSAVRNLERSG